MESLTSLESNTIRTLIDRAQQAETRMSRLEGQRAMVVSEVSRLQDDITSLNNTINDLKLLEAYLSRFADERQAAVFNQIEATVSEGLRAVFREEMRLEITTKMVGARSEVVFTLISDTEDGELATSIMESRGGGVAAIVGFLIQAVIVLLTPGLRPVIFLDESFRAVSSEYQTPLGEFISDLCSRTGLQVILITHNPEIVETADRVYSFEQLSGKTKIKKVI